MYTPIQLFVSDLGLVFKGLRVKQLTAMLHYGARKVTQCKNKLSETLRQTSRNFAVKKS